MERLYRNEGRTLREIGKIYDCSYEYIRQVMEKYGVERNPKRRGGTPLAKRSSTWVRKSGGLYQREGL